MKWIRYSAGILAATVLSLSFGLRAAETEVLTDMKINQAVETQLSIDRAIPYPQINVVVSDGIVELTGTVDNVLAKERAAYVAEHVRGVRAVSNRITVSPDKDKSRTDAEIRSSIVWALANDPAADSYEIEVSVEGNVATLRGAVESFAEKQLAGRIAKGVSGVVEVENQLGIEYADTRLDPEIRKDVEERLRWNVLISDGLLDVAVNDGKVTLTGTVGSAAEKRQAHWDAWVFGVKDVDVSGVEVDPLVEGDDLRAGKYATKSDAAIREAVKDAALYDPRVYSFAFEPKVENGWVTLIGSVDNVAAKHAAARLARNTVGVRGVTNMLDVRPDRPKSDAAIAADVRAALQANQYTDSFQLDLEVENGVVRLSGNVETPFEKNEAARVAAKVNGTRKVENDISTPGTFGDIGTSYYFSSWYPPAVSVTVQNKSDATLLEDVNEELFWSPFVDSDEVGVEVQSGIVILNGQVNSWREYRAAEENAFEAGATSVVNNLNVNAES